MRAIPPLSYQPQVHIILQQLLSFENKMRKQDGRDLYTQVVSNMPDSLLLYFTAQCSSHNKLPARFYLWHAEANVMMTIRRMLEMISVDDNTTP